MAKKPKLDVKESGSDAALKHNPFGALASVASRTSAPAASDVTDARDARDATDKAAPPTAAARPAARGRLVLRRETKHRAGKAVIIVSGFEDTSLDAAARKELAKSLKVALACGGGLQSNAGNEELLLNGDQPARVAELLRAQGFRVDGVTS